MVHTSDWHIRNNTFQNSNNGLEVPTRNLRMDRLPVYIAPGHRNLNAVLVAAVELQITNLDRTDPPRYQPGGVPRTAAFNQNIYQLTTAPAMPVINIECDVRGFDPTAIPIHWRLICRHVLCRHAPQGNYRYAGVCEELQDEWHGTATSPRFTLFANPRDQNVIYTYNTDFTNNRQPGPVMGGHAILSVAAFPNIGPPLLDYVHLRIGGNNPRRQEVLNYIGNRLADRNENIIRMLRAVFAHEADFIQFRGRSQTRTRMRFRQRHHRNNVAQPDCNVVFNWPDDPPNFPLATFDFGVGISQYTRIRGRRISREIAWDWRANVDIGINTFLAGLRRSFRRNLTWRQLAWLAYRNYNGSGPQAQNYANTLAASRDGQTVDQGAIPQDFDERTQAANLEAPVNRPAPPAWPPGR